MMRGLLEERFKLTIHHLTKDFPVYELAVAKNGPKLKESVESAPAEAKEGFPSLPAGRPGRAVNFSGNRARLFRSPRTPLGVSWHVAIVGWPLSARQNRTDWKIRLHLGIQSLGLDRRAR
jgi:uncharacterized protein (TIGR03435 family)